MKLVALAGALALVLAALGACKSGKDKAAQALDPTPYNAGMKGLADRTCGCNNDPACVKLVRADWDAGKKGWLGARASFAPGPAAVFDSELSRMQLCGDAAGVTFWREL